MPKSDYSYIDKEYFEGLQFLERTLEEDPKKKSKKINLSRRTLQAVEGQLAKRGKRFDNELASFNSEHRKKLEDLPKEIASP